LATVTPPSRVLVELMSGKFHHRKPTAKFAWSIIYISLQSLQGYKDIFCRNFLLRPSFDVCTFTQCARISHHTAQSDDNAPRLRRRMVERNRLSNNSCQHAVAHHGKIASRS
jgi:hypothetical protein